MMNQLGRLRKKTMSHMNQLQPVMKAGDVIEAQIEPLLAILHHPARQPPILFKMISGLHRSLTVLGKTKKKMLVLGPLSVRGWTNIVPLLFSFFPVPSLLIRRYINAATNQKWNGRTSKR